MRRCRVLQGASVIALVAVLLRPVDAPAAEPDPTPGSLHDPRHHGFFMAGDLGGGAFFLSSNATASNGFRQSIPMSVESAAFSACLALGYGLPDPGLVLGARVSATGTGDPTYVSRGRRFTLRDQSHAYVELAIFGRYYLDRRGSFHLGAGLGWLGLGTSGGGEPIPQTSPSGASLSPEVGYAFWLDRKLRFGFVARVTTGYLFAEQGNSVLLAPVALASLSFN